MFYEPHVKFVLICAIKIKKIFKLLKLSTLDCAIKVDSAVKITFKLLKFQ